MKTPFSILLFTLAATSFCGQAICQAMLGSGYVSPLPATASPGQLFTIYVQGVGADIKDPVQAQTVPLPTTLAGISVGFEQTAGATPISVPLTSVFPVKSCGTGPPWCSQFIGINIQVPYEMTVPAIAVGGMGTNIAKLTVYENGNAAATLLLQPATDSIHILRYGDSLMGFMAQGADSPYAPQMPVVTHADGSLISILSPAAPGETVIIYAVGIGFGLARPNDVRLPRPQTGTASAAPTLGPGLSQNFDVRPNATPSKSSPSESDSVAESWAVGGFPGLYQVNVTIPTLPSTAVPCGHEDSTAIVQSNLTINLSGLLSSDGAQICVSLRSQ